MRVPHVRERLAVGRGLRLVRAVDHVRDLLEPPRGDLEGVDVRDAGAVRVEIEPGAVRRVDRVAVHRAIAGDVGHRSVLRVDHAHVAVAPALPRAVRDVPVVRGPSGRERLIEQRAVDQAPHVRDGVHAPAMGRGDQVGHHQIRRPAVVRREHDAAAVGGDAGIERAPAVAPALAAALQPARARLVRGQLEEIVEGEQVLVHVGRAERDGAVRHERRRTRPVDADHELAILLARAHHLTARVTHERQRPLARPRVPVVDVVEEVSGVLGPGRGRDPARVLDRISRMRQPRSLAEPARANGARLRAEAALHRVDPGHVQLLVGAPRGPPDRAVDPVRDDLVRVVVDHRADRLLAVRLGDPLHEERAVEVPDVALGPAPRDVREHVERRDRVLEHVRAHPHVPHRRTQPAAAGSRALLEDREPLEEPVGLHLVGSERLAEHLVQEGGDARDVIRVQDVRVLVRDELEVPVVDVPERRHVVGRGHVEPDRVVGKRSGRAVRAVGLVGEDDLGLLARRPPYGGHEARVDRLCERRHVLRDFVLGRIVVDSKVLGFERLPQKLRIVRRARTGDVRDRRHDDGDEKSEAAKQAASV